MEIKQTQKTLIIVASSPEAAEEFYHDTQSRALKDRYPAYRCYDSRAIMYTVESLTFAVLPCARLYRDFAFVAERIKADVHEVVYGAEYLES